MEQQFRAARQLEEMKAEIRTFPGGATRDSDIDKATGLPKPDYHRFLDHGVLEYYCTKFMLPKRVQADGKLRNPDNWKCGGFGFDVIMASLTRHYWSIWGKFDAGELVSEEAMQELSAILFNTMAMMREIQEAQRGNQRA